MPMANYWFICVRVSRIEFRCKLWNVFSWGLEPVSCRDPTGQEVALRNLVVRLAEKATDYHHRDVKAAFGRWDDGYIVLHGAWCEPLHLEVVKRLECAIGGSSAHAATSVARQRRIATSSQHRARCR